MIAPPNTLRTDDAIVQYYKQAAEAIGEEVPFVIQDYPLTFSVQMTPAVIRRIVGENASCAMLKHEDWPGLAVRKHVMMRRGIIASDALRKPGAALTPAARAEVDYLLSRLARKDARARV
jgi:4-hydroxy-tetrahydrodipicolinate synthase